ncbi:MAG TPA: FAD-dependent monooxygenase [Caulobacteraceae bacterium]|nr:FAD-dependent monooxygenase [Caulobacteraceae bacterium]
MAFSDPGGRLPVLVSGAGVAGLALAYWLLRAGRRPVLVETAPAPRTGGYMIDFWGPGFEVAERMGAAQRLRAIGCRIAELRLVDARGRPFVRLPLAAFERELGERYVSLLRSDLAAQLLACVEDRVDIRFDDEIVGLAETGRGVDVMFRRGAPQRFELVIGADGAHSKVRRLAFGAAEATVPLGRYVAAFTARDYPHGAELAYVSRTVAGRQAVRCALKDGRTAFFLVLTDAVAGGQRLDTADRQREMLTQAFSGIGWEARDIVQALNRADDLYFDAVAQVRLPMWSAGRVALTGDAAWAPSLLAGEGASFAMAGAYLLAGELAAHPYDHRSAFVAYERRLRRYIVKKQNAALRMGGWFAPKTALGVVIRNQLTRLAALPGFAQLMVGPMVADDLELPVYDWRC